MSKSARSIFFYSLYLVVLGLFLILVPNILLNLFRYPETSEVWIRVVGMLVILLGFYFFHSAINDLRVFFQATVYARASVPVFFVSFVLLDFAEPVLILFGAIDGLSGLWTQLALWSEVKKKQLI
ncbi:MAG: hypothetical protein GY714_04125 [Desulfobacterales bacterium]|nr:hypothetical protein [Desulfobacterales bacterium]MCP4163167.1 hypothetical protein [Deltaproteobacteria bacterium]